MPAPDEPASLGAVCTERTVARWGSLQRHYIKCLQDRTVPPALQQLFIDQADAFTPGNRTKVRSLDSGHSPFFSMPMKLAEVMSEMVTRGGVTRSVALVKRTRALDREPWAIRRVHVLLRKAATYRGRTFPYATPKILI